MRLVSAATNLFVGGAVIAVSGCFPPPTYYPQPGMYQQPIQTLQPGGTYVPGSGTYAPGSTIQSTPPSGSLTPLDGGNAPTYQGGSSTGSSGSTSTQSPRVPNPPANSPFYESSSSQTFENPITTPSQQYNPPASNSPAPTSPFPANPNPTPNPFGNPPAGTQEISFPGQQVPTMLEVRTGPQLSPNVTVAFEADAAADADASLSVTAHETARFTTADEPTFDHDRQQFAWLHGIVSFDEADAAWNIVYSDVPESSDPYAGCLTLSRHPDLEGISEGTEVIVYGTVDPVLTDDLGRPMYVVTRVVPVEG